MMRTVLMWIRIRFVRAFFNTVTKIRGPLQNKGKFVDKVSYFQLLKKASVSRRRTCDRSCHTVLQYIDRTINYVLNAVPGLTLQKSS